MANKGNRRHINRLASGKYIKVGRKTSAYVAKPMPGRHPISESIALCTVLTEKLGVAATLKETEKILREGLVKVNGKAIREPKYPIGFGDTIVLEPTNELYTITVGSNGEFVAGKGAVGNRIFKVLGKYIARKGRVMVRLHNGTVMPSDANIKVNDSVELDGKTVRVIKMEPGRKCVVRKGTHASESGTIKAINQGTATREALVLIEGASGEFETLLDNIMVTG